MFKKHSVTPTNITGPHPKIIHFSGYEWVVKSGRAKPGPNNFSDNEENVQLDSDQRLHLRITYRNGQWHCAEIVTRKSFGYGTYKFSIESPLANMDPSIVLGLFTWNNDPAFAHRELDIEFSRWGDWQNADAQFVVQPWNKKGHTTRFSMPKIVNSIHSFTWRPKEVLFKSSNPNGILIHDYKFSNDIPKAGGENTRINLWLMGGHSPENGEAVEVVINKFEFIPE